MDNNLAAMFAMMSPDSKAREIQKIDKDFTSYTQKYGEKPYVKNFQNSLNSDLDGSCFM